MNASVMTDNMNIITALYNTSKKIELVEILALLSIHWCTCEINSYKIMFLAPHCLNFERDISLAQWSAWIGARFFTSCGNRIIEFSRIVCRGSRK